MNVFLIGFRCTGKTTVGNILAGLLGFSFVDTDERFVIEAGQSIDEVVKAFGWDHFRQREAEIMVEICAKANQVVATGGGVILNHDNIIAMNRSGTVVWLDASVETITARMKGDIDSYVSRPSLTGKSPTDEIGHVVSQRKPHYRQAADIEVFTDGRSPASIAHEIVQFLKPFQMDG